MKSNSKDRINTDASSVNAILAKLDEFYPADRCYLEYTTPWQLLFATIMSAQCTDARVNLVTRDLFVKYPDLKAFAQANFEELKNDIRSTGFYHNKAKNIIGAARMLLEQYDGEVPSDIEELTKLPGVGRKTANVIRCHIYGIPSIVVDTHVKRISRLLGLTDTDDPVKAEFELMDILPEEHWTRYNIQLIRHGRTICLGGRPRCDRCFLRDECRHAED